MLLIIPCLPFTRKPKSRQTMRKMKRDKHRFVGMEVICEPKIALSLPHKSCNLYEYIRVFFFFKGILLRVISLEGN